MKVLMIISDGFDDVEMFTAASVLRRAGTGITLASLSATNVVSATGVNVAADKRINEITAGDYDTLLLPSFRGMENSQKLLNIIKGFDKDGKLIVAMSQAPLLLAKAGVIENKIATVYPGMESRIPKPRDARIVIDGNIITSRSASDSMELALKLVEIFHGKAKAKMLREKIFAA